jgi:hypothetical protein
MTSSPNALPVLRADSGNPDGSTAARVVQSVKSAVRTQESEIKRWRRTFDANAKAVVDGEKCVFHVRSFRLKKTRLECPWQIFGSRPIR